MVILQAIYMFPGGVSHRWLDDALTSASWGDRAIIVIMASAATAQCDALRRRCTEFLASREVGEIRKCRANICLILTPKFNPHIQCLAIFDRTVGFVNYQAYSDTPNYTVAGDVTVFRIWQQIKSNSAFIYMQIAATKTK